MKGVEAGGVGRTGGGGMHGRANPSGEPFSVRCSGNGGWFACFLTRRLMRLSGGFRGGPLRVKAST